LEAVKEGERVRSRTGGEKRREESRVGRKERKGGKGEGGRNVRKRRKSVNRVADEDDLARRRDPLVSRR
jgi:hypothetical protein